MELELGLALPNQNFMKGFDLNKTHLMVKPKEKLGLRNSWSLGHCLDAKRIVNSKRSFEEAFGDAEDQESFLLVWNGQPNEEDDRYGKQENPSCPIDMEGNGEGNRLVGWPPIKSWRRKLLHQNHQGYYQCINNNYYRRAEKENQVMEKTMYVKVKMEGVTIVRKVDLRLYNSYQMLKTSLIAMFAKFKKDENRQENYTLTYMDKEGKWLSAGDHVPWRIFMDSARRLEIFRNRG